MINFFKIESKTKLGSLDYCFPPMKVIKVSEFGTPISVSGEYERLRVLPF
jgi:hypothetical protein